MTLYSQRDPRWSPLDMGASPYSMGQYGCLTTAIAQAFELAGWTANDPGVVCTELSKNGGYTGVSYPQGPGLVIWDAIARSFPEFHWRGATGGAYSFVQVWVVDGAVRYEHFLLELNGTYYDPIDGTQGLKGNYQLTGFRETADIDAPVGSRFPLTVVVKGPLGLKVRQQPTTASAAIDPATLQPDPAAFIDPGNSFVAVGEVAGQDPYGDGRDKWLATTHGFYVWNRDNY